MILYLETSALVKKYFDEKGSSDVISLWKQADAIATSAVAYAEAMAAFYRKFREGNVDGSSFEKIIDAFEIDWKSVVVVMVSSDLNRMIKKTVSEHSIRGFDTIHLASALIINETVEQNLIFCCYDNRLLSAASAEKLEIFPTINT